jgi:hypothetical protein
VLQHLTNGLGGWALIGALVALVIGAAGWALGSHAQNFQQSITGRKTVLVAGTGRPPHRSGAGHHQLLLPRRTGRPLTCRRVAAWRRAVTGPSGQSWQATSSVVGLGISAVFDAAGQWVASGAVWLLGQVGRAMSASTTVDLSAGWFSAHESVMVAMAAPWFSPWSCAPPSRPSTGRARRCSSATFLVQLPLALLLTGVAVELVQMALAVTDVLSAQVLSGAGVDTTNILAP